MDENEGHNGWPNWETWNVYNWLSSNEYYQWQCVNICDSTADIRNVWREGVETGYVLDSIDMDEVDWDRILDAFTD